jgi:hypothetical protein
LDDNASQFSYQPSDAWKTDLPSDMSGFQGGSGQYVPFSSLKLSIDKLNDSVTQNKDASAKLSFSVRPYF